MTVPSPLTLTPQVVVFGTRLLQSVRELWRSHSATLGFMPDGAFDDACLKRELICVVDPSGTVAGYVLFRNTRKGQTVIVHLCVSANFRGHGVARLLFREVLEGSSGSYEIRLRCRRDFDVNSFWPKLGFIAVQEVPAKKVGASLVVWRYELAQLPLLALLSTTAEAPGAKVTVDANVFYDLDDGQAEPSDSPGLAADWLTGSIQLVVTEELLNEINRQSDPARREYHRQRVARFPSLPRDPEREQQIFEKVRRILPDDGRPSTDSDARQLAMSIAADVAFFVTRDQGLLEKAEELASLFGIEVLEPYEIVRRFDELRREEAYRPQRLSLGVQSRSRSARSDDMERLADLLHRGEELPEKRNVTRGRLKEMLSQPGRYHLQLFERGTDLLGFFATDNGLPGHLRVPYFAVEQSAIGRTAAYHYVQRLAVLAAQQSRLVLEVEATGHCASALGESGFKRIDQRRWVKMTLRSIGSPSETAQRIELDETTGSSCSDLAASAVRQLRLLSTLSPGGDNAIAGSLAIERTLWPAKICGMGVPCVAVPIQPRWAKDLFDHELAEGTLFGGNPQLVLSAENVYYRAPKPAIVTAPSRVIWYVSGDRMYPGSGMIRACSYVDEVVIGTAKDLFRRYRRLGIYEWNDVCGLAKGNPLGQVMAFRFSGTEVFSRPVAWDVFQGLLREQRGKGSQLQGPLAVPESIFFQIYERGISGVS